MRMKVKKILVVDNNPTFAELMSHLLIKQGHKVLTADGGLSALEILKSYRPDIIFVDLVMHNIDGEKLCRIVRGKPRFRNTWIIILSALAAEQKIDYIEWGADACVAKGPFDKMSQLVLDIVNHLDSKPRERIDGKITRIENIRPRAITKELFSLKQHLDVVLASISEGILEITVDNKIVYVNPAAAAIIENIEQNLLTDDFSNLFKKADQNKITAALKMNGEESSYECVLLNGKRVLVNIVPIKDDAGKRLVILSDITERRKAEEELRYRAAFENLVQDISARFINISLEKVEPEINEGLRRMGEFAGVDRSYVFMLSGEFMNNTYEWCAKGITSHIKNLKNISLDREFPWFAERIRMREVIAVSDTSAMASEAEAEKKKFLKEKIKSLLVVPMISGGSLIGFLGFDSVRKKRDWSEDMIALLKITGEIFVNALNRSRTEKALRDSERKYKELADLLPQVVFETDKNGRFTFINQHTYDLTGYSRDDFAKGMEAAILISPEDRDRAKAYFRRALKRKHPAGIELTAVRKNGETFPVIIHSTRIVREKKTVGLRGIAVDIRERKLAEGVYRTLADKSFAGVYVSQDGKFKYLNPVFATYTGYSREELLGRASIDLVHPDDKRAARSWAIEMLKGKRKTPYEFRVIKKDGKLLWAAEMVSSIFFGGKRAVLGNFMDLTERKTSEDKLKYLSTHDVLTGLYNRAFFEEEIDRLEHGRRFPVSILIADIDLLKEVNDTFGHAAGDELIRRAASVLKDVFRKEDVVARIGGDEFAVIWPGADKAKTDAILSRIRKSLERHNRNNPGSVSLQLSVGIATGEKGCSLRELMKEADERMYSDKVSKTPESR